MAKKVYTVELHAGRDEAATRARLRRFTRFIFRLGGDVTDDYILRQGTSYVRCMAQIKIPEERAVEVAGHPSVWEVREPPKVAW